MLCVSLKEHYFTIILLCVNVHLEHEFSCDLGVLH